VADDRRQLLEEAERQARKGNLAAAAACYRKLLEKSPEDAGLLQRLGDALARSGQEAEARAVLRRLADQHWKTGLRSRAIAALRRAVRLGEPDPAALELLGDRCLEAGLAVDAREPLLEAAALREQAGEVRESAELLERLVQALPRDVAVREQLLRLTAGHGSPRLHVRALALAAEGRALAGRPGEACEALAQALDLGGEDLPALELLPAMVPALASLPAEAYPERLEGVGAAADAAWRVLRAAILAQQGDAGALAELRDRIEAGHPMPARARLFAGRVFLAHLMIPPAESAIDAAAAELQDRPELRQEVLDAIGALLARSPGNELAEAWKARFAAAPRGAGDAARRTRPAPVVRAGAAAPPQAPPRPQEPTPTELVAKLVEARALLEHRLPEKALETLTSIPAAWREREDVAALIREAAASATRRADSAMTGRTRPEPTPPLSEDQTPDDDGLLLVLDLEEGSPAAPVPAPPPAPARPADAGPGGPDLGELERALRQVISEEDAETEYQMAIGLIEMGLGDQAAPLLESLLAGGERAADAALALARVHGELGDLEAAERATRAGLAVTGDDRPAQRGQLLAAFAAVCEARGSLEIAAAARAELAALAAVHPGLLDPGDAAP
jgi:tetratricopeptide (TPR) repeat protein